MFLDGKHLQITQSHDTTNYLRSVLHTRPGLDLPLKLHVLLYSFAVYQRCKTTSASYTLQLVHLCATYALKLYVLVHSFAACQRCGATFKSYMLQTKLISPCATYALMLHVRVRFLRPTKDAELPPQGRPGPRERKIYKRQGDQRQRINRFLSAFVSLCLSPHFLFCPPPWDNQWPSASHCSERCFSGHLGSLTPL